MTNKIEFKNLTISKINESETRTEDDAKKVWTYTIGDKDDPVQFTLKTGEDMGLRVGQKFTISMFNPQEKLPGLEAETEAILEILGKTRKTDEFIEKIKEKPELMAIVGDDIKQLEQMKETEAIVTLVFEAYEQGDTDEQLRELAIGAGYSTESANIAIKYIHDEQGDEPEKEPDIKTKAGAIKAGAKNQKNIPDMMKEQPAPKKKSKKETNEALEEAKEAQGKKLGEIGVETDAQGDLYKGTIAGIKKDKLPASIRNDPEKMKVLEDTEKLMATMDKEIEERAAKKKNKPTEEFRFETVNEPIITPSEATTGQTTVKVTLPKAPKTNDGCKHWYRGGLCSNNQMDKPFCVGVDKCPIFNHPEGKDTTETPVHEAEHSTKLPSTEAQEEIGLDEFLGETYQYPLQKGDQTLIKTLGVVKYNEQYLAMWKDEKGGYHRIRSKAIDPRESEEAAQEDLNSFAQKKKLNKEKKTEDEQCAEQCKEQDKEQDKETYYDKDGKRRAGYDEQYRPGSEKEIKTEETEEPEKMSDRIKRIRARQEEEKEEEKKPEPEEEKQVDIKKPHSYYKGYVLVKRKDMPKDILGGLLEDVVVDKNENADILFAHAVAKEELNDKTARDEFANQLEQKSGIKWTWVINKLYNADTKQLNTNRQREE